MITEETTMGQENTPENTPLKRSQWLQAIRDENMKVFYAGLKNESWWKRRDREGNTVLILACKQWTKKSSCHGEIIESLLDLKWNVNAKNEKGEGVLSSLLRMVDKGLKKRLLKKFIEVGGDVNTSLGKKTSLMVAIDWADEMVLQLLIEAGAPLETEDEDGETVLMKTCQEGLRLCTKVLIEKGANLNHGNHNQITPFMAAIEYKNATWIQELIEQGGDVNHKTIIKKTPLIVAVKEGTPEIVEVLLKAGAHLEEEDDTGETALGWAIRWSSKAVDVLLQNGSNVNHADKQGETPLMKAVQNGELELVKKLIEHGADETRKNNKGETLADLCKKMKTTVKESVQKEMECLVRALTEHQALKTLPKNPEEKQKPGMKKNRL